MENGNLKDNYFTKRADCKDCPIRKACIGKSHEKRINITAYHEEYERNIERVKMPARPLYERQTTKHCGTCFWHSENFWGFGK
ncbi:hypothetical protein [Salegentibacter salinarum]|nr:hypothetical protein [Salegentibacter salinarum]